MQTEITNQLNVIKTTEKITVDSYPYGRLRATAFFSLEFQPKKGFRSVFQTIDPKNGRLNKPKNSTYYPMMIMHKENETGHIKYTSCHFNGAKETNRGCEFMFIHFDMFTDEQIQYIYSYIMGMLIISRVYLTAYNDIEASQLDAKKQNYTDCIELCKQGMKSKENIFNQIYIK